MYRKYVYSGITWFDIRSTQTAEIVEIAQLYQLDSELVKKIANKDNVNQVIQYSNCIYVSLNIPCCLDQDTSGTVSKTRASFVLGSDFVLTTRFDDIRGFKEAKTHLSEQQVSADSFSLFFLQTLLSNIYSHLREDITKNLPNSVLTNKEVLMKKHLRDYERIVARHEKTFAVFSAIALEFFADRQSSDSLQKIMDEYEELRRLIKQQKRVHLDCLHPDQHSKSILTKIIDIFKK